MADIFSLPEAAMSGSSAIVVIFSFRSNGFCAGRRDTPVVASPGAPR